MRLALVSVSGGLLMGVMMIKGYSIGIKHSKGIIMKLLYLPSDANIVSVFLKQDE